MSVLSWNYYPGKGQQYIWEGRPAFNTFIGNDFMGSLCKHHWQEITRRVTTMRNLDQELFFIIWWAPQIWSGIFFSAGRNNNLNNMVKFMLKFIWRLRTSDAKPTPNFKRSQ